MAEATQPRLTNAAAALLVGTLPLGALLLGALLLAVLAGEARAVIQKAVVIDGPNSEIVGFGGVAMASDGSGGLVYLKRVNGIAHVFAARYSKGRWGTPVEIAPEEPYQAIDPCIGAAPSGELLVVWATPFATINERTAYHLMSSVLYPGSPEFSAPIVADRNVGEGEEISPDLAMSSGGSAYLAYRVLEQTSGERRTAPLLRPGDVFEEVRVARFNGGRWSDLGAVNHDRSASMRPPTPANAPKIALAGSSSAVVVWQEPDASGVARIWARRIFGTSVEYPMLASATSLHGAPIDFDAGSPAVAVSKLGEAIVAYRQQGGSGSPLPGPRIFANVLPDGESEAGNAFRGAEELDATLPGGEGAAVGPPSVDIDERRDVRLLYDADGSAHLLEGEAGRLTATLALDAGFSGSGLVAADELAPATVLDPAGGGVSAWPSADVTGAPALAIEQRFPGGAAQSGLLSAPEGGPISAVSVGRSGLGDAIVGFQQGPVGDATIVASSASAPPANVEFSVPQGWIPAREARVEWTAASSANGPLTYTVVLDGHRLETPAGEFALQLPARLPPGVHRVQMLVTDASGQSILSVTEQLLIGPAPPELEVAPTDGGKGILASVAGGVRAVVPASVRIHFGDGSSAAGRLRAAHRYGRAGRYLVQLSARTRGGQMISVRRTVKVR